MHSLQYGHVTVNFRQFSRHILNSFLRTYNNRMLFHNYMDNMMLYNKLFAGMCTRVCLNEVCQMIIIYVNKTISQPSGIPGEQDELVPHISWKFSFAHSEIIPQQTLLWHFTGSRDIFGVDLGHTAATQLHDNSLSPLLALFFLELRAPWP